MRSGGQMKRLLIANRGEIAARIIASARELGLATIAIHSGDDIGHTQHATEVVKLSSAAAYLDIAELLRICQEHKVDAIHPGYGFLSESADFADRASQAGVFVVGPGAEILDRTGDKLRARQLAEECGVPVLPALAVPTSDMNTIKTFAEKHGLPVMVKAVDGGGGRGIRLVRTLDDLKSMAIRAIEESPSKQVFAERAAVDGFRHIEVQIVGDGRGNVVHLFERECSIQRRYQKVVEIAPSTLPRDVVAPVIDAAVKMALKIKYRSLGTFEFLLNPHTKEYYFLEINPRLQVEHTVTESIYGIDIVKSQIRLAQGVTLDEAGFRSQPLPQQHSIQLRLTAEDAEKGWTLSTGKIDRFRLPGGNGVRVDTALVSTIDNTVTADFDSVIAKIIVTASTWSDVIRKAQRAIEDAEVVGIETNIAILAAIVAHPDFEAGQCDTQWLEVYQKQLLITSKSIRRSASVTASTAPVMAFSSASTLFRKDDAWSVALTSKSEEAKQYHLRLQKVLKNDFPASLSAQVVFTAPETEPVEYLLDLKTTTASAAALTAQHRRGDPKEVSHIIIPFSGKLIELSVDVGDVVKKGDCIAVVQQMKMELEVRSPHDGIVTWVCEIDEGEDVSEGVLGAVVEPGSKARL